MLSIGDSSLCIKPVADGNGAGVARLDSAADLGVYAGFYPNNP